MKSMWAGDGGGKRQGPHRRGNDRWKERILILRIHDRRRSFTESFPGDLLMSSDQGRRGLDLLRSSFGHLEQLAVSEHTNVGI